MIEYEITCVRKDDNGKITHVGFGGGTYEVSEVVERIKSRNDYFYTYKDGKKARVYRKQSTLGNWFLTTDPDSTKENNLDFLPPC